MKKTVLFVCTHNSARSQMAEAFLRTIYGEWYEALSAGTEPRGVHPLSLKVMAEVGIDISAQRSKSVEEFLDRELDLVVTVCDSARESCPYFPFGRKKIHQSFPDPAAITGTDAEKLAAFRRVRDEIKAWVSQAFDPSPKKEPDSLS
jgi:arsenate reductase